MRLLQKTTTKVAWKRGKMENDHKQVKQKIKLRYFVMWCDGSES